MAVVVAVAGVEVADARDGVVDCEGREDEKKHAIASSEGNEEYSWRENPSSSASLRLLGYIHGAGSHVRWRRLWED